MRLKIPESDPYLDRQSLENRFRAMRFRMMETLIEEKLANKSRIRILDLGGTEKYWTIAQDVLGRHAGAIEITVVNTQDEPVLNNQVFSHINADGCDPDLLPGESFDIVHSNSVIEHVGDWERIHLFRNNILRLGDNHFVQTPNYWFPVEPHFRFIGFQWLPRSTRIKLVLRHPLGFYDRAKDEQEAASIVDDIRLLTRRDMKRLFPHSQLVTERFFGFPKSIVAMGKGGYGSQSAAITDGISIGAGDNDASGEKNTAA